MEESTKTSPSYVLPSEKSSPHFIWKKPVLIGLAIIPIVVAVVFAMMFAPVRDFVSNIGFYVTAPAEAKNLVSADQSPGVPAVFQTFGLLGMSSVPMGIEGLIIDYAERGDVRIASVVIPQSQVNELYLLGATPVALTGDGYPKTGLAISADGSHIAYSAPKEKRLTGPYFSLNAEGWTVMVMNLSTAQITEVGAGHGAQFADPTDASKILYSSTEGLVFADLATGARVINDSVPAFSAIFPIHVSDDGRKVLIFDSVLGAYQAYTIDRTSLALTPIGSIPERFVSAAITDTHTYWVKKEPQGNSGELWSQALEKDAVAKKAYTFLGDFVPVRVTPRH